MEKVWIMKCPSCSHELPQGLKNRETAETMGVNCPKCQWQGLAKNTSLQEMSFEDWMGPGYTKENSFLSQQEYEQMLNEGKGKVNLDTMFANHASPTKPSPHKKSDEEIISEYFNERFTPHQLLTIEKRLGMVERVEVDNPEAVEAWNNLKDLEFMDPELRKKWEEALTKKT